MFLVLAIFVTIIASVLTRPDDHNQNSFLFNSSQATKDSFDKMIANLGNLTDAKIDRAIEVWNTNQTDIIQANYKQFKEDRVFYEAAAALREPKMLEKLAPIARDAYDLIHVVYTDPSLVATDKVALLAKIINSLPYDVRKEISEMTIEFLGLDCCDIFVCS